MQLPLPACRKVPHWVVMPVRALAGSLAVVVASIAVVGAILEFLVGGSFEALEETSIIRCASSGVDGRALFLSRTVFRDGEATRYRLWMYDSGCEQSPVPLPWTQSRPSCLAWIPGTQRIVVGGWDGSIHLADLTQPEQPPRLVGRHVDGGVMSLQCSADGRYLASRTDRSLRAWDLASENLLWDHPAGKMVCH